METIAEGVFFTTPPRLPRGRHDLSREQVAGQQHERLMIAATELMAERGYAAIVVKDIAARARLSLAAFYGCFSGKDECVFAAYERFIAVLVERMVTAVDAQTEWDATVVAAVSAYVDTLASDLVVARAFQVEMDALGRPAREQRRAALAGLAALIRERREDAFPDAEPLPESAYVAAVYGVRQLVSDRLDEEASPDLASLVPEMSAWMSRLLTPAAAPP